MRAKDRSPPAAGSDVVRLWIDVLSADTEDARPMEMPAEHRSREPAPAWGVRLWGGFQRPGEPPLERGRLPYLPYLGCALEFGRDPGAFLAACQERHGDVFTVLLAGHRTTFILDPFSYPTVLKLQRELTFDPIADEIASPTFGYPRATEIPQVDGDALRDLYGAYLNNQALAVLSDRMQEHLERLLAPLASRPAASWHGDQLYDFIYRHLFHAGGRPCSATAPRATRCGSASGASTACCRCSWPACPRASSASSARGGSWRRSLAWSGPTRASSCSVAKRTCAVGSRRRRGGTSN